MKDGQKIEGKLLEVNEAGLVLEETKGKGVHGRPTGKKKEIVQHQLLLNDIKSTKLQIVF
jgi:hypothetical protein